MRPKYQTLRVYNSRFNEIDIIDLDQQHMLGRVHSLESSRAVDGPGLRFVIFLQAASFSASIVTTGIAGI